MTTTQQKLPGAAVVASVEATHRLATTEVRPADRVRLQLLALDVAAAAIPALVLQRTLDVQSPFVPFGVAAAWVALLVAFGGYAPHPGARYRLHARAVLRAACGLAVALWALAALLPTFLGDTATAARASATLILTVPLVSLGLRRLAGVAEPPSRVVVAGDPQCVNGLLHDLRRAAESRTSSFRPVAVCLPDDAVDAGSDAPGLPVWPGLERVADAAQATRADAVIVVPGPGLDHDELRRLRARLRLDGTDLLVSTGLRDVSDSALGLGPPVGVRLLHVRPMRPSGAARVAKYCVDRVLAALLLMVLSPLLAVLIVLVRLDSPGAALFRQTRVGQNGRPFTMIKLRTMRTDADRELDMLASANECDADSLLFKIRTDPRITSIGAVLRKYSLDELPQLVNVMRGEMSLVGPRPALPGEARAYSGELGRRLDVKPGMTGLWQVSGRSDLTWGETVRLDLAYVDNWSWGMDLAIAARTVGAVVGHRGAY